MPLYEYECSACGRRFELLQKLSEEPTKVCIHCDGHVHRLISASAFQFKGTGWYVSDYARKGDGDASTRSDGKSPEGTAEPNSAAAQSKPSQESKAASPEPAP
ncbi:MAG: hypothetical protein A3G20_05520 [Acidobacteria bacterium RIFCSPLOWO2_12_FULL_59_11]|nr:MAG: hypothetical protein A3G20_05520 [Acidobacteria bacterium RIFCSPLOWO2_12_FULL_59_11]